MASPSPQEFKEEVRSRNDIVGLISETVALQPRSGGREYVGLCPFHDDHDPSMRVNPERQSFRCWACNTGGDCFGFVEKREGVTFREALEILARRANLEIPKYITGRTQEQEANRATLFDVLQWAEGLFHKTLLEAPYADHVRAYLRDRGVSDEMVRQFRLGFHPDNWEWLLGKARGRYSPKLLLEARLIGERQDGSHFDNFVDRVIFPIHNERGQAVSFGGRILPGSTDERKYWNGPESTVFHKSRLLYAIHHARDAIREVDQVLITEGYTDCIACHQYGVKNVVGTLGTALTDSHVTAIKRYARKVVLVFDGDEAGQKAALKSVERFLAQDVDLKIMTLPDKMDPADYLQAEGADSFRALADAAPEAWEFQFRAVRSKYGMQTVDGRERILNEMLALLAKVPDMATSVRESLLVANLAQRLSLAEDLVRGRLKDVRVNGQNTFRPVNHAVEEGRFKAEVERILRGRLSADERVECDLLQNVLGAPEFIRFVADAVSMAPLRNRILKGILEKCFQEVTASGSVTLSGLLSQLPDQDLKGLTVWLDEQAAAKDLARKMRESDTDEAGCPALLRQSIDALQNRAALHSNANVSVQLSQSTDGQTQLDEATELLLRQAAEFHQKRATKKSSA